MTGSIVVEVALQDVSSTGLTTDVWASNYIVPAKRGPARESNAEAAGLLDVRSAAVRLGLDPCRRNRLGERERDSREGRADAPALDAARADAECDGAGHGLWLGQHPISERRGSWKRTAGWNSLFHMSDVDPPQ